MIDPHGEPVRENYRRQGEARERERILTLLQPAIERNQKACEHAPKGVSHPCGGCQYFFAPEELVALIEGKSDE